MARTYLAHHELESEFIVTITKWQPTSTMWHHSMQRPKQFYHILASVTVVLEQQLCIRGSVLNGSLPV